MFFFFNGFFFFFFNDTATTEIYTLSLHDALPIFLVGAERDDGTLGIELFLEHDDLALDLVAGGLDDVEPLVQDQLLRSEEHTSELQSQSNLVCRLLLEKKKKKRTVTPEDISRCTK